MPGNEAFGPWRIEACGIRRTACGTRTRKATAAAIDPTATAIAKGKCKDKKVARGAQSSLLPGAQSSLLLGARSSLSPLPALVAASLLSAAPAGAQSSLSPNRGAQSSLSQFQSRRSKQPFTPSGARSSLSPSRGAQSNLSRDHSRRSQQPSSLPRRLQQPLASPSMASTTAVGVSGETNPSPFTLQPVPALRHCGIRTTD